MDREPPTPGSLGGALSHPQVLQARRAGVGQAQRVLLASRGPGAARWSPLGGSGARPYPRWRWKQTRTAAPAPGSAPAAALTWILPPGPLSRVTVPACSGGGAGRRPGGGGDIRPEARRPQLEPPIRAAGRRKAPRGLRPDCTLPLPGRSATPVEHAPWEGPRDAAGRPPPPV